MIDFAIWSTSQPTAAAASAAVRQAPVPSILPDRSPAPPGRPALPSREELTEEKRAAEIYRIQRDLARRPSLTLEAMDGRVIATQGDLYGEALRLKEMPAAMPQALMAIEDRRFLSHPGIDPVGLLRAAWAEVKKTRGALAGDGEPDQISGWQP